ncbi:3-keto-5-aminohexanoate cleavage protein [Epidermidibacterium keratini]|uniref:3-keto-5-aminohexanoate cleavage protein n=1 Tax=Epidermidibacterium keratini TaxID=1891644 RepID=A0A7L4YPF1_9ACTN|nr:3-keto-5-aminohexanoate cleavage protein [Epidermidibacterium keratini]QHC00754.1 3-keto-5-aminohexanoate cleavage protein [Epidermidibacterium keratini]
MTNPKVWLEVALNGNWGRRLQPRSPITVDEVIADGIACVREGAGIVHVHAYDGDGRRVDSADTYRAIIEGIRSEVDAIVYPTIAEGDDRYAVIEQLARDGLLEWAVLDPGTVNLDPLDEADDGLRAVYENSPQSIARGFELATTYGFHPAFAIYEPGFVRAGIAHQSRNPGTPTPIYRLMFSTTFAFGMPPTDGGFTAYAALLDELVPDAPRMLSGLGIDVRPLVPVALEHGAHIRVGLEDFPLGATAGNAELVREMVEVLEGHGRDLATATDVRNDLAGLGE